MKLLLLIIPTLLISNYVFSEEKVVEPNEKSTWGEIKKFGNDSWGTVKDGTDKAIKKAQVALNESPKSREERKWKVLGNYSYFDLWIPSKIGFSLTYSSSEKRSWEFEYLKGSFSIPFVVEDLGKFVDTRMSLLTRSFPYNSNFNYFYGLNYNHIEIFIGDKFLASITPFPSFDVMSIKTLGFTWGLGHRWQFKNRFIVSVDWFQINIPLLTLEEKTPFLASTTNASDREDAQDVVDFFKSFPTIGALKFQLGISF